MSDVEKARSLFEQAGLSFPTIPEALAGQLKEREEWRFSTRTLPKIPYDLRFYTEETDGPEEYAVLSHDGHGVNSYAIQYYLVTGPLRMFLHLGWGGAYMDHDREASKIRTCFALADAIVSEVKTTEKLAPGERLTIVGADFYGSSWSAPRQGPYRYEAGMEGVVQVLSGALAWLRIGLMNSSE